MWVADQPQRLIDAGTIFITEIIELAYIKNYFYSKLVEGGGSIS
jgi:hypothetical protein